MKKCFIPLLAALCILSVAGAAFAHVMVVYTPEMFTEKGEDLDMRILFTHPSEAGTMMDMGGIEEFYVLNAKGDKVMKTDLKPTLKDITWKNPESEGPAFSAMVPRKTVRSMGDYVFVMKPGYYYEKKEDIYMQQIVKVITNVGGMPTIWADPVGLPCEFVPMIKPYGLWAGNVFQAQILSGGKPAANAEVEVAYMSHLPNLQNNTMPAKSSVDYPGDMFITQTIVADDNGVITYGIPKAGWWGFVALGVGTQTEHNGKELSQDATIWVQAMEMK